MLLIYPPLAKACEPPAGITRLAGFLLNHGHDSLLLDANLEGQLHLFNHLTPVRDTWSSRAIRNISENLTQLRNPELYRHQGRYQRIIADLNRIFAKADWPDLSLSLANYQDSSLSPLKSIDLMKAAENPATNIFSDYFSTRLAGMVKKNNPVLIGFSLNYLSQALTTFAMIGFLKQNYPAIPLVVGGGLITSWLINPVWHDPFQGLVDHFIAGPGESPLLQLLQKYSSPTGKANRPDLPPTELIGSFKESWPEMVRKKGSANHQIGQNFQASCPIYHGLPSTDYLAPGLILPYAASSGCYWLKCSFCPEKSEGNPYYRVPTDVVLDQIRILKEQTNPVLLHFLDNAISPSLMHALIDRPPGIDWYSFARIGAELADPDFCISLRRSGCVMLKLGLESGDQNVLDAMNKGISLTMAAKVLANLEQAGIATYIYLLFGTPTESLTEARHTLDFTVAHSSSITFLNLAIFNMPTVSRESSLYTVKNFYDADLSLYVDFKHPLGWSRQKIRHFLDREFKRHPAITPIMQRDPPLFSSNHAPFLIPIGKAG